MLLFLALLSLKTLLASFHAASRAPCSCHSVSSCERSSNFGAMGLRKLILGVDVFDLDLGVKINSIEQPIKSNSMSSGNMSHCWTSAFHNHFDHSLIVLKHIQ